MPGHYQVIMCDSVILEWLLSNPMQLGHDQLLYYDGHHRQLLVRPVRVKSTVVDMPTC